MAEVPNCSRCKYRTFIKMPALGLPGEFVVCGNCGQVVGYIPDMTEFKRVVQGLETKIEALSPK